MDKNDRFLDSRIGLKRPGSSASRQRLELQQSKVKDLSYN
jgi:hypothetical protein